MRNFAWIADAGDRYLRLVFIEVAQDHFVVIPETEPTKKSKGGTSPFHMVYNHASGEVIGERCLGWLMKEEIDAEDGVRDSAHNALAHGGFTMPRPKVWETGHLTLLAALGQFSKLPRYVVGFREGTPDFSLSTTVSQAGNLPTWLGPVCEGVVGGFPLAAVPVLDREAILWNRLGWDTELGRSHTPREQYPIYPRLGEWGPKAEKAFLCGTIGERTRELARRWGYTIATRRAAPTADLPMDPPMEVPAPKPLPAPQPVEHEDVVDRVKKQLINLQEERDKRSSKEAPETTETTEAIPAIQVAIRVDSASERVEKQKAALAGISEDILAKVKEQLPKQLRAKALDRISAGEDFELVILEILEDDSKTQEKQGKQGKPEPAANHARQGGKKGRKKEASGK